MTEVDYRLCQDPSFGHNWDPIPVEYVPNTYFPYVEIVNKRCLRCGAIAAPMVDAENNTYTLYQTKSYPEGYFYSADDVKPSVLDRRRWVAQYTLEMERQRQEKRVARQKARQPVKARAA